MEDYYQILGVPQHATQTEIKQRYRFLSQAYHPDKFSSAAHKVEAEATFKRIGEAYAILADPVSRARYDRQSRSAQSSEQHAANPVSSGPPPVPPSGVKATAAASPGHKQRVSKLKVVGGIVLSILIVLGTMFTIDRWRREKVRVLTAQADRLWRTGGKADKALELYEEATRIGKNFPETWYALGTRHVGRGNSMIDLFRVAPTVGADSLARGREHFSTAIKALSNATRLAPDEPRYWEALGKANDAFGLNEPAASAYRNEIATRKRQLEANSNAASSWASLGDAYARVLDTAEATNAYETAVSLWQQSLAKNPGDAFAWSWLGDTFAKLEMYDDALRAYERCLDIEPDYSWVHSSLVLIQGEQRDAQLAAAREQLKANAEDAEAWFQLGDAYERVKNFAKAAAAYKQSVAWSERMQKVREPSASDFSTRGRAFSALGRFDEERVEYQRAERLRASAKVSPLLTNPRTSAPDSPEHALASDTSLPNGTIISAFSDAGGGTFTIINDAVRDAFVKVVDPGSRRRFAAFYVKAASSYTLKAVPDGSFAVYFTTGFDWDEVYETFKRRAAYFRFDAAVDFRTTKRREGDYLVTYTAKNTITLKPVLAGNAKTSGITAEEFRKN